MSESSAPRGENHQAAPQPTSNRWHAKQFRIDRGRESPGAAGSLLRTFQGWKGTEARPSRASAKAVTPSPVTERRGESRHHQPECLAWVSWKTFWRMRTKVALVIDLSRGGARIFVDQMPPARKGSRSSQPFWVFLEADGEKVVIRAEVREIEQLSQGQCAVRVKFLDPCPYALFESAVCGMTAADPRARLARSTNAPPPRRPAVQPG